MPRRQHVESIDARVHENTSSEDAELSHSGTAYVSNRMSECDFPPRLSTYPRLTVICHDPEESAEREGQSCPELAPVRTGVGYGDGGEWSAILVAARR